MYNDIRYLVQVNHVPISIDYLEGNLELSDHNDPVWDCTFHYSIRPSIYITKNAIDTSNIKLAINADGYIVGFDIIVNNTSIPGGENERDRLGGYLKKILAIKSGMTIEAWTTGYECKDKVTGHWHSEGTLTLRWSRHGWIDILDLNDQSIQNILNSRTNPNLETLSSAVSNLYEGRLEDSIKTAYGIIENKSSSINDYWKFNCIRNVLTHETLYDNVIENFKLYFGTNVNNTLFDFIDFKENKPNKSIIILNLESEKTRKTLNNIATELINECKKILGLQ